MIYLVRHGEPESGWGDAPDPGLSGPGKAQAEAVAQMLAEAGARTAVTSPLARCRQTAAPFERLLETHARLEPSVGEVRTPAGLTDRPAWLRDVMAGSWAEAGEALEGWRRRVLAAVEAVPGDTAVFTHFVAINAVVSLLTGDERVLVFRPGHCSVTRLERSGGRLHVAELGAEAATKVT
ncbi:MAG: histidine phosphatase family protein [Hyphomonadaceae bacterium]